MREDEKQFFIAMLKNHKFQSYIDGIQFADDVAEDIGLNKKRAEFLLEKWYDYGFWNYGFGRHYSIISGWFELENLIEPYKEIYDKYMQEIDKLLNETIIV